MAPPKPPPKPRFHPLREENGCFEQNPRVVSPTNANIGLAPIHGSKSSPSLNQTTQQLLSSPVSRKLPHLRNVVVASPWKNSLDSLNNRATGGQTDNSPARGFTTSSAAAVTSHHNPVSSPRQTSDLHHHWKDASASGNHQHSNSDSGLSSLSGRTSTMSPISTMSTVSSVSSTSSSGSSSRASLRSASIVSSCTIPLDEEDEEAAAVAADSAHSSPSGTFKHVHHVQNGSGRRRMVPPPPPPPSSASSTSERLPEELECDEMAKELMERIKPGDTHCKKLTALFGELPVFAFSLIVSHYIVSQ